MFDRVLIFNADSSGQLVPAPVLEKLIEKKVTVAQTLDEALTHLETLKFYIPLLVTQEYNEGVQKFIQACHRSLTCLPDLQIIVCPDPSPQFQGALYELGIKNLWPADRLESRLSTWVTKLQSDVKIDGSIAQNLIKLGVLVARAKKGNKIGEIDSYIKRLSEDVEHDYRICYTLGQACLLRQQFDAAEQHFVRCQKLNPRFVPAFTAIAQLRLQSAKPSDALVLLEKMEKLNSNNSERKALLAAAYADAGDWEKAKTYLQNAEKLEPNNSKVREMRVRAAFEAGDIPEALRLLDECDVIEEYFVTKLNDQAIALSKLGNTQNALDLYKKAHDLASPHIKYKLSFNIAIAYRRQGDLPKAIQHLDIVDSEFGERTFEKSVKLRAQIKEEMEGKVA